MPGNKRSGRRAQHRGIRLAARDGEKTNPRLDEDDEPLATTPDPPRWLTGREPKRWFRHFAELVDGRILTEKDLDGLAHLARAQAEFLRLAKQIEKEGDTIANASGGLSRHPSYTTQNELYRRIERGLHDFGLTPAGRASLPQPKDGSRSGKSLADYGAKNRKA